MPERLTVCKPGLHGYCTVITPSLHAMCPQFACKSSVCMVCVTVCVPGLHNRFNCVCPQFA